MTRPNGKPPKLKRWEISFIKRAARLRKKLTNKALGQRFGISDTSIQSYIHGVQRNISREDYDARVIARRQAREARRQASL